MNSLEQASAELQQQNWLYLISLAAWPVGALFYLRIKKMIEAIVLSKQHFSRLRYEHELALYREIWKRLCVHSENSFGRFTWNDKDPDAQTKSTALQNSGRELFETIRDNRPFYPEEIWLELSKFVETCDNMTRVQDRLQGAAPSAKERLGQLLEQDVSEAKEQYRKVEEAIRRRLDKFNCH